MNRRDFFKRSARDIQRIARTPQPEAQPPANRPAAQRAAPVAGRPDGYQPGDLVLIWEARAWLGRDRLGFYAFDAVCPHLGCLTTREEEALACPCHGSRFMPDGRRLSGPARADLPHFEVDLDEAGRLVIRRGTIVDPGERFIA